jgi:sulfonate transport system ATP-binding protein
VTGEKPTHRVGFSARRVASDKKRKLSGRRKISLTSPAVPRQRKRLGALDALTRLEMQQLLEDVWRDQGFTALLVTHDVAEAVALADRTLVLDAGRVALVETVEQPRPRWRGDAGLAAIEGRILSRLMRRQAGRS